MIMKPVKAWVNKVDFGNKMRAFVNFEFSLVDDGDSVLTLKGFKLFQGDDGLFLAAPSEKYEKDGETKWSPTVFIDQKDDQGKELWDQMTQVANKFYNMGDGPKGKPTATKPAEAEAKAGEVTDDDVPW